MRKKEKEELESRINQEKEHSNKSTEEVRRQMAEKIERQLAIIEQLIKDKEQLQLKIEDLLKKTRDRDGQFEKQKEELMAGFKREIKKEKEAWLASEKVRKEKWESEKIQEIKQGTVQQLQPTIQQIFEKNKEEQRKLQEAHQTEMRRVRDLVSEEWERKLTEMRDKMIREREEALEKERAKSQQKIHEQYERME